MANNIISPNDGAPVSSIDTGDRVRFTHDNASPEMQVVGIAQGGLCVCGWFAPDESNDNQRSRFNMIQVAPVCLERIDTVNKLIN